MKKRILLGFILVLLLAVNAASQASSQPWWYIMEQGKLHFRNGSYGNALLAFEDARRSRLAQFTRMEQDLILLLSLPDVRRLGDSLEMVEKYISDLYETRAASALAELYYRVPKESLKGSALQALEELGRLKSYPEAEFWLGETYRAEGELSMAVNQYERALQDKRLLENPGLEVEILYKLVDIHRIRGNYQEMERRAREIIAGQSPTGVPRDIIWNTNSAGNLQIRAAMARILENEGANRFLLLYRDNNTITERAHRLLGFFYYATGRYIPASEHLMFAFLIQNTILIEELIRRDYDFTFTTLDNLMSLVRPRAEFQAFLEETEYYRTIHYFASALYATGKTRPSTQLWTFLAGCPGEWGERARRNPSPYIERPLEMP